MKYFIFQQETLLDGEIRVVHHLIKSLNKEDAIKLFSQEYGNFIQMDEITEDDFSGVIVALDTSEYDYYQFIMN